MKPTNRKNQKRTYLFLEILSYVVIVYIALHMAQIPEENLILKLQAALHRIPLEPFNVTPIDWAEFYKVIILALLAPLLIHAEYLRRRDLRPGEESGSARWNENLRRFYADYAEITGWPPAFQKIAPLAFLKKVLDKINKLFVKIPLIGKFYKKFLDRIANTFVFLDETPGNKNMIFSDKVFMSMDTRKTRRNNNIMVIGGSGSGKSRFVVKPNLLQANCSFVITDPSGELLDSMGVYLEEMGYEIRVFNLVEMEHSNTYNPFHYIRNQEGVLTMINAVIKNTTPKGSSPSDPFWEKAETALLQAICFYLVSECNLEDQNFSNVMKLLRCAKAIEGREDEDSTLDILFNDLAEREPEHIAVQSYAVFKSAGGGKTAQSILISCQTRLQTFNLDAIKKLTSTDNIDLGSVGDKKVALFCITPVVDTTFNYLVALMYTQLFETLYFHAETQCEGMRLPYHVRFMLDEFANIGTIPEFSQKLATMRKYEISCTIIIQALSQIKAMYEKDWEVLIGNCDSLLFLGGSDATTLEYISKRLGKETISSKNRSRSYGKSGSFSENWNKTGRELLTPDEIGVMDNNNCILFIRGLYPFFTTKYNYPRHQNYHMTGDANKKNMFDKKAIVTGEVRKVINKDLEMVKMIEQKIPAADVIESERIRKVDTRKVEKRGIDGRELHVSKPTKEVMKEAADEDPCETAKAHIRMLKDSGYDDMQLEGLKQYCSDEEELKEAYLNSYADGEKKTAYAREEAAILGMLHEAEQKEQEKAAHLRTERARHIHRPLDKEDVPLSQDEKSASEQVETNQEKTMHHAAAQAVSGREVKDVSLDVSETAPIAAPPVSDEIKKELDDEEVRLRKELFEKAKLVKAHNAQGEAAISQEASTHSAFFAVDEEEETMDTDETAVFLTDEVEMLEEEREDSEIPDDDFWGLENDEEMEEPYIEEFMNDFSAPDDIQIDEEAYAEEEEKNQELNLLMAKALSSTHAPVHDKEDTDELYKQ